MRSLLAVAVPLPLPEPLSYEPPEGWTEPIPAGVRVRVRVGRRRHVGVVVGEGAPPPEGVTVRPILEILDSAPVVTAELLELAEFVADYYLAPIGEVLRSMIPSDLEPWGRRRVRLTDRGALARLSGEREGRLVELLRDEGPARMSDLAAALGTTAVGRTVDELRRRGLVTVESHRSSRGARYRTAVELASGDLDDLVERCGRSRPGREIVAWLHALGRPATVTEACEAVGCTPGVVKRLADLGIVRRFTEIQRLDLEGHMLPASATDEIVLREDQRAAVDRIVAALGTGSYAGFLLSGMTGSGKTEVYLRAAEVALEEDRSVLLLVPEIALVPALARTVRDRFGEELAVLHSGLGRAERAQEWERIRSGRARIVLGPRSAIFAPVADLGLVVVDEEQDGSYKQDKTPRYNGRDLALVRASREGAVAVLVSATPSLESRRNVEVGKLGHLVLTRRVGQGELPEGTLVDLRREPGGRRPGDVTFSSVLRDEISATVERGEQVILLRNRRGYAPTLLCRACGEDHRCDDCGLAKTFHRRRGILVCHYCGAAERAPDRCRSCDEEALEPVGAGTERVEETFGDLFPGVPVAVLDRDTARSAGGPAAILERFARGEVKVLIGTQMVSKGHHFPRVALAGVLAADTYLGFPDFRAVERTYALLTQLAGRAGRGERPGRVVIQTYHPDHYAIRAALDHDDEAFASEEMRFRRVFHYPPFTRMIHLLVRDEDRGRAESRIREVAAAIERDPRSRHLRVSGPAPAPLERLRGRWRFQLLLRGPSGRALRELVPGALEEAGGQDVVVDVDPLDLL